MRTCANCKNVITVNVSHMQCCICKMVCHSHTSCSQTFQFSQHGICKYCYFAPMVITTAPIRPQRASESVKRVYKSEVKPFGTPVDVGGFSWGFATKTTMYFNEVDNQWITVVVRVQPTMNLLCCETIDEHRLSLDEVIELLGL